MRSRHYSVHLFLYLVKVNVISTLFFLVQMISLHDSFNMLLQKSKYMRLRIDILFIAIFNQTICWLPKFFISSLTSFYIWWSLKTFAFVNTYIAIAYILCLPYHLRLSADTFWVITVMIITSHKPTFHPKRYNLVTKKWWIISQRFLFTYIDITIFYDGKRMNC